MGPDSHYSHSPITPAAPITSRFGLQTNMKACFGFLKFSSADQISSPSGFARFKVSLDPGRYDGRVLGTRLAAGIFLTTMSDGPEAQAL